MRIGIAVMCRTRGGPKTYGYNLLRSLSSTGKGNEYVVLTDDVREFRGMARVFPVEVQLKSLYALPLWDYVKLSTATRRSGIHIFHNTKGVLPFFIPCKSVVTIHDMAPFIFPHTFPRSHRIYLQHSIRRAAARSDCVITVSENSRRDILRILRIPEAKVRVVYNGVHERFRPLKDEDLCESIRRRYNLPDRFILYVGTLQPRKNVDLLIRSYCRLKRKRKVEHRLVIVGRKGWLVGSLMRLVEELGMEGEVVFTGYVPEEDLPAIYSLSDLFVYPSSYEGFGLSVLEAMACGTPVVTTNVSSLPEVVGDAGLLLDTLDEVELANAIWTLLSDDALRQDYARKGLVRTKKFSWERTAEETLKVYSSL